MKRLLLAVVLASMATASMATDALKNPISILGNQAWTSALGLDFNVGSSNLTVTRLGAFDDQLVSGFSGTILVGIFDRVTQLQVGGTATFNSSGVYTLSGAWEFQNISAITLLAGGQYSLVAVGFSAADQNYNTYDASSAATDNGGSFLTFVGSSRYEGSGSGLVYPGTQVNSALRFGSANMTFTPAPEPLTMGLGFAGVGLFVRRRLKARKA